ncbi:expressed unknown protein (Partial), partial [Seminavis robusta]|eukprot:Sro2793_g337230.1 n/a (374) ;mRNA; r:2-1124
MIKPSIFLVGASLSQLFFILISQTSGYIVDSDVNIKVRPFHRSPIKQATAPTALQLPSPQRSKAVALDPSQYNAARIKRGQQFFQDNMVVIANSWALIIVAGFADTEMASALLSTKATDTAEKAQQRYHRTFRDLLYWHTQDLFDPSSPAVRQLRAVKSMHNRAAASIAAKADTNSSKCPFSAAARNLVKLTCHHTTSTKGSNRAAFIQSVMARTQASFVAMAVTNPKGLGIHDQAGLEDFVYLWWALGKELGIEDKYNVCSSLATAKKFVADEYTMNIAPALAALARHPTQSFETLANAYCDGIDLTPENVKVFTGHSPQQALWTVARFFPGGFEKKFPLTPWEHAKTVMELDSFRRLGRMPAAARRLLNRSA